MKKGYINLIKNLQTKQGIKILVSSRDSKYSSNSMQFDKKIEQW